MRFYGGGCHKEAHRAITESLAVDVRSLRKTKRQEAEVAAASGCSLKFDGILVSFSACHDASTDLGLKSGEEDTMSKHQSASTNLRTSEPSKEDSPGAGHGANQSSAAPAPLGPVRVTNIELLPASCAGGAHEGNSGVTNTLQERDLGVAVCAA
ncbi:unnamed protein product [Choristocarpus tenellus]